jgi:hypothetical protein
VVKGGDIPKETEGRTRKKIGKLTHFEMPYKSILAYFALAFSTFSTGTPLTTAFPVISKSNDGPISCANELTVTTRTLEELDEAVERRVGRRSWTR